MQMLARAEADFEPDVIDFDITSPLWGGRRAKRSGWGDFPRRLTPYPKFASRIIVRTLSLLTPTRGR
jgi:hypothetical protein